MTRFSNSRDRTLQNRMPGVGLAFTHNAPTEAERQLQAIKSKRIRAAKAKPAAATEPAAWPAGFVSQIQTDKHGRMV